MGMFDHLIIDTDKLPISSEDKKKLGDKPGWQTKSFDNDMTEVYITNDNRLKIIRFDYKDVPKEERPYPDDEGILGLCGCIKRINERLEDLNYHGYMSFHAYSGPDWKAGEWFEFVAKFTDGVMVEIKRIKEKEDEDI